MSVKVVAVGIDSLNIGFNIGRWLIDETAFKQLEDGKQSAGGKLFGGKGVTVNWGGKDFNILAKGTRGYDYVMHNDDIRLYIAKNCQDGRIYPEVFVQLNSPYLWGSGYNRAYNGCMKWLGEWAAVEGEKVNRVDVCADLALNLPVLDLSREVVTRARKKVDYLQIEHYTNGRHNTGYRFGSGGLMVRIYDKSYEIKSSEKYWFQDIWKAGGWDETTGITRIEYQARRPILKDYQVNSYDEMLKSLPDMWRYMTSDWLDIKEQNKNDSNNRRWNTSPMWKTVQEVGGRFGEYLGVLRYNQKQAKIDPLMAQTKGLITSIVALDSTVRGKYHSVDRIKSTLNNFFESPEFDLKVIEKRGRYASM